MTPTFLNHFHPTDHELQRNHSHALTRFLERKHVGFPELPARLPLWKQSEKLGQELASKFDTLVVLGIGGSSLGAKVIEENFGFKNTKKRVLVWDNIDDEWMQREISTLGDLKRTVFAAISKSGTTLETLTQVDTIDHIYSHHGLRFTDHAIAITEFKQSPLYDWAKKFNVPLLEIPLDVGGRFSVLSPVGLLPAAFLGADLEQLRHGAESAVKDPKFAVELSTQAEMSFERHEYITCFWMYSNRLKQFGLWIQQLWAESLAKKVDVRGNPAPRVSTPIPMIGATDQHSTLQQIMEGHPDKYVIFFRVRDSETSRLKLKTTHFSNQSFMVGQGLGDLLAAEAQATARALSESKVSNSTVILEKLDEFTIGHLFMSFELCIATLGERFHINAFDQPGVELGKVLAKMILKKET